MGDCLLQWIFLGPVAREIVLCSGCLDPKVWEIVFCSGCLDPRVMEIV